MRAIQHFYKKFGRYPSRVEELENTNNVRFLRKRYTDPMSTDPATGKEKDFKFLHQQDILLNNGPVLGPIPGPGAQTGTIPPSNTPVNPPSGGASSGDSSDTGGNPNSTGTSSPNADAGSDSGSGLSGQVFGGGPIFGVASTNKKDKTIRVFFGKTHYNDWLFIYVSIADRGGLLIGPVNPSIPTPNLNPPPPGALPQPGLPPNGGPTTPPQPPPTPTPTPQQ